MVPKILKKEDFTYNITNPETINKAYSLAGRIKLILSYGKRGFEWEPTDEKLKNFLEDLWIPNLDKVPLKYTEKILINEINVSEEIPLVTFLEKIESVTSLKNKNAFIKRNNGAWSLTNLILKEKVYDPSATYLDRIWKKMEFIQKQISKRTKKEMSKQKAEAVKQQRITNMIHTAKEFGYKVIKEETNV